MCIGVVDPRDASNMVPSCVACNVSHRHESRFWCGASQPRLTRAGLWQCYGAAMTVSTAALLYCLLAASAGWCR